MKNIENADRPMSVKVHISYMQCSRYLAPARCACPEDRRRPGSTQRMAPHRRPPGREISDRESRRKPEPLYGDAQEEGGRPIVGGQRPIHADLSLAHCACVIRYTPFKTSV